MSNWDDMTCEERQIARLRGEIDRLTGLLEDGRRDEWPKMWCETCRLYRRGIGLRRPVPDKDYPSHLVRHVCCTSCGHELVIYLAADPQGGDEPFEDVTEETQRRMRTP